MLLSILLGSVMPQLQVMIDLRILRDQAVQLVDENIGCIGILGVVLQHDGHWILHLLNRLSRLVVACLLLHFFVVVPILTVRIKPQMVAVSKIDVSYVVHFVNRN